MPEATTSLLRIRVVNRISGVEITSDLPTLHGSSWHVIGYQPGNPSNSAIGTFSIELHPPGSPGYAAAKAIYDQLARYLRIEAYISHDGASLGNLFQAGPITGIDKQYGETSHFTLTGSLDTQWANLSKPFPGELLPNDVTYKVLKSYLGTNELGWSDTFSTFTAGNYTSTNTPGKTSGTWSGTTDDGFSVVSCATGTGAVLISKSGAAANDRWHSQFVEATGRLKPSADTTNAGIVGVGISSSTANVNDCVYAFARALKNAGGRWNLDVGRVKVIAGVVSSYSTQSALLNVDDAQGYIPFTIGLLLEIAGNGTGEAVVTVNGSTVIRAATSYDPGTSTRYPFLLFQTPSSGTATGYLTNFVQMTRFTTDGPSTAAAFANGTITSSTNSLGHSVDPGATFLDVWSSAATRENFYWRYTPTPYVIGTRTLGTVDFSADPGTDYGTTKVVVFSRDAGNLVSLQLSNNADPLSSGGVATALSTPDGGGLGFWRDIGTMTKYGVIEDQNLAAVVPDFNSLRRSASQIWANKIAVDTAGAKTALVMRDPGTADKWRELDKVMIQDPEMNVFYQVARILAYTFDEGLDTQSIVLDQFSADFTGLPHANPRGHLIR